MSIMKCEKCRKGYLIVKQGPKGYFLGCINYKKDGTGCNYTISQAYYLEHLNALK